jgi:cyclopropane fatty-acyl-phospholipid synthase-like methyltransferase
MTTGNPNWPTWYPQGAVFDYSKDPYGPANAETLRIFDTSLEPGDSIVDIAGGYGKYGEPLARVFDVTIVDIDEPHLTDAERRARLLPEGAGRLTTLLADVTRPVPELEGRKFDAALIAGFIYLAPEDVARKIFQLSVGYVSAGGLVVVEFATERDRREKNDDGSLGKSLIGPEEAQYSRAEGEALVRSMFADNGLVDVELSDKVIHLDEEYYLHNELIIASGRLPA